MKKVIMAIMVVGMFVSSVAMAENVYDSHILTGGVGAYYSHQEEANVGIGGYLEAEKFWLFGTGDEEVGFGFKLNPGLRGVFYSYFNKEDIEYANISATLFSILGLHATLGDNGYADVSLIPVGGIFEYNPEMEFEAIGVDSVPFVSPLKVKFIINNTFAIPLELGFFRVGFAGVKDQGKWVNASYIMIAPTGLGAEINLNSVVISGKFSAQYTIYLPEESELHDIVSLDLASLLEFRFKNTPVGLFYRLDFIELGRSIKVTEGEDHFETVYHKDNLKHLLGLSLTLD